MTDEMIEQIVKLGEKELILAKIIVWLKTKGLYEECLSIVAPEIIQKKEAK